MTRQMIAAIACALVVSRSAFAQPAADKLQTAVDEFIRRAHKIQHKLEVGSAQRSIERTVDPATSRLFFGQNKPSSHDVVVAEHLELHKKIGGEDRLGQVMAANEAKHQAFLASARTERAARDGLALKAILFAISDPTPVVKSQVAFEIEVHEPELPVSQDEPAIENRGDGNVMPVALSATIGPAKGAIKILSQAMKSIERMSDSGDPIQAFDDDINSLQSTVKANNRQLNTLDRRDPNGWIAAAPRAGELSADGFAHSADWLAQQAASMERLAKLCEANWAAVVAKSLWDEVQPKRYWRSMTSLKIADREAKRETIDELRKCTDTAERIVPRIKTAVEAFRD